MSEERWLKEATFFDDRELLSKPIDELTEEDLQIISHVAPYGSENKKTEERKEP